MTLPTSPKYRKSWRERQKQDNSPPLVRSFSWSPDLLFDRLGEHLDEQLQAQAAGAHPLWQQSRDARLAACENDLELFGRIYCPERMGDATPAFHRELIDLVHQVESGSEPGLILAAPRGHAKTTVLSFLKPLHDICFRKRKFIIIISDTATQAILLTDDLRREFEGNSLLKADFGPLADMRGRKWTSSHFITTNNIRVLARGTGSQVRGLKHDSHRPDLVICDDAENDELVATKEQRDKLWEWWNRSVVPMLEPKRGKLIVVGTVLHMDSLLIKLLAQDAVYKTRTYRAELDGGGVLWPELYDKKKLAQIKSQIGSLAYNSEYLNMPIDEETQVYRPEWWKWYTKDELVWDDENSVWLFKGLPLTIYQGVDPAIGTTAYADWFAHITIGVNSRKDVLLLWPFRDRLDFPTQVKFMTQEYHKWSPRSIGIEEAVYQRALRQQIVREGTIPEQVLRGLNARPGQFDDSLDHYVSEETRRATKGLRKLANTKQLRIVSRSVLAENGQLYLREALPTEKGSTHSQLPGRRIHHAFVPFFEEATTFPRSANDDLLDAFDDALQCVQGLSRWGSGWYVLGGEEPASVA